MTVIVVAGIPGSGKTTLANQLGPELGAVVLSKDVIKESLMDALGTGDLAWNQQLSRAAHQVMYELAGTVQGLVLLEAHFHRGVAEDDLRALGRPLIQIYCRCPVDLAWSRYQLRRDDPARHSGHLLEHQDEAATLGWRSTVPTPLDLDGPLIEVDTTRPVDVAAVVRDVNEAAG